MPDLQQTQLTQNVGPTYEEVRFNTTNPVWPTLIIRGMREQNKFGALVEGNDGKVMYMGEPWPHQSFFMGSMTCKLEVLPKCQ